MSGTSQGFDVESDYARMTDEELACSFERINRRLEKYVTSFVAAEVLSERNSFIERLVNFYFDIDPEESAAYWRDQLKSLTEEYRAAVHEAHREERVVRAAAHLKEPEELFDDAREKILDLEGQNVGYVRSYARTRD